MALEDVILTKIKGEVLVNDEDEQVCINAVNLQRRESLSFSRMISILILGINLKIFATNQELNYLFKRWSSRLADVEIKISYDSKRGEKSRDP